MKVKMQTVVGMILTGIIVSPLNIGCEAEITPESEFLDRCQTQTGVHAFPTFLDQFQYDQTLGLRMVLTDEPNACDALWTQTATAGVLADVSESHPTWQTGVSADLDLTEISIFTLFLYAYDRPSFDGPPTAGGCEPIVVPSDQISGCFRVELSPPP